MSAKFVKLLRNEQAIYVNMDNVAVIYACNPDQSFYKGARSIITFGGDDHADCPVDETPEQILTIIARA